jgi:hypothetical protein
VKLLKTKKALALAAVMVAATGGTAMAVLYPSNGGAQLQMINVGSDTVSTTNMTAWTDLPGATTYAGPVVTVPAATTQLVNARFTAESDCSGDNAAGDGCLVRILAVPAAGAPIELSPRSGRDFAFDSVPVRQDYKEAHAMERSAVLGEGSWTFKVQYAVSNMAAVFDLDDWHLAIETSTMP